METRAVLLGENDRVRDYLKLVIADLSDEQVKYGHTAVDDRPIGAIVQHIYGSLVLIGRIAAEGGMPAGGRPVPQSPPETKAETLALIERMHSVVADSWSRLSDAELARPLTLPWGEPTTGAGALLAGVAHAHRHIGNIIDARCLGGFKTLALG